MYSFSKLFSFLVKNVSKIISPVIGNHCLVRLLRKLHKFGVMTDDSKMEFIVGFTRLLMLLESSIRLKWGAEKFIS